VTRQRDIERIYANLALVSRRARARAPGPLSFVGHTLLAYLDGNPGSRAADLASLYGLDKSTISRQLTALERHGYLHRGERQGRDGTELTVTAEGRRLLAEATRAQLRVVAGRVASWPAADVHALAGLLDRFND